MRDIGLVKLLLAHCTSLGRLIIMVLNFSRICISLYLVSSDITLINDFRLLVFV